MLKRNYSKLLIAMMATNSLSAAEFIPEIWQNPYLGIQVADYKDIPLSQRPGFDTPLSWSPNGRFLIYRDGNDGQLSHVIKTYDKVTNQTKYFGKLYECNHIAWSPDGDKIAITSHFDHANVLIIELSTNRTYHLKFDEEVVSKINQLAWSSDGKYLAAGLDFYMFFQRYQPDYTGDTMFVVWQPSKDLKPVAVGKLAPKIKHTERNYSTCSIAWTPDNKQIISSLYSWHTNATYENSADFVIWNINYIGDDINSIKPSKFITDNKRDNSSFGRSIHSSPAFWAGIANHYDTTDTHSWNINIHSFTNKIVRQIPIDSICHANLDDYVAFSPDGKFIAHAGSRSRLLITPTLNENAEPITIYFGKDNKIYSVVWSPDNESIVVRHSSHEGNIPKMSIFSVRPSISPKALLRYQLSGRRATL
ncbi:hypothetical protein A3F66_06670 [candidate division TM6 bacterium RIFCSPHIGHO2_12_FULL_32_22]|nr:MAG: hypothetical protein A3F66_06670 [candidate division TM6 bacterium RIFCSPHIGHO2_12_FULL_32_22]